MLNEEEENKLDMFIEVIALAKEKNHIPRLNAYDMEWLANKCAELNKNAAGWFESYDKTNNELIALQKSLGMD